MVSRFGFGLTLLLASAHALAAPAPHQHAEALPAIVSAEHGPPTLRPERGGSRAEKTLRLHGIDARQAWVLGADGERPWAVPVADGRLSLKARGPRQGGYHWIDVQAPRGERVVGASTLVYFSNPGPAPRGMLTARRDGLAITPVELPREHRHYRAGERWAFSVRVDGEPLANATVEFVSDNGTRQTLHADGQGLVSVEFPHDFGDQATQAAQGHGHARRRMAGFTLSASHDDGRQWHDASFNYHYTPGAFYGKDLTLGLGFAVLGMVAATPLLRRRGGEAGA